MPPPDPDAAKGDGLSEPDQMSNPLMSAGAHPHDRLASAVGAEPLGARSRVAPGEVSDAHPGSESPSAATVAFPKRFRRVADCLAEYDEDVLVEAYQEIERQLAEKRAERRLIEEALHAK